MAKLLIIADDLTGAADTGVQLAKRGVPTVVLPSVADFHDAWQYETVVVNTESRHSSPGIAAEAVTAAVRIGQARGVQHFYKKTDSTLRGNIGGELQALLHGCGAQRLIFVPAFPRLGHTTVGGIQYVHEVELHKTEYARDLLNPINTSVVAELVHEQADAEIHSLAIRQLAALNNDCGDGIYIFDCGSDGELREISSAVSHLGWTKALAGSAGFADCLADLLTLARQPSSQPQFSLACRILVVNGSMNPAAALQISRIEQLGYPVVNVDGLCAQRIDETVRTIQMQPADCVVLSSTDIRVDRTNSPPQDSATMLNFAENLGRVAATAIERADFQLMIVFGGDTYAGIARALQCTSIVPQMEILPGVPLSKMYGGSKEIFAISKAGGFGGDDILPLLFREVRRMQS